MIQASSSAHSVVETPVVKYRPAGGLQWKGVRRIVALDTTVSESESEPNPRGRLALRARREETGGQGARVSKGRTGEEQKKRGARRRSPRSSLFCSSPVRPLLTLARPCRVLTPRRQCSFVWSSSDLSAHGDFRARHRKVRHRQLFYIPRTPRFVESAFTNPGARCVVERSTAPCTDPSAASVAQSSAPSSV